MTCEMVLSESKYICPNDIHTISESYSFMDIHGGIFILHIEETMTSISVQCIRIQLFRFGRSSSMDWPMALELPARRWAMAVA